MTRIRTRLLTWLLPPLIAFIALISIFFYLNWYGEIEESFKTDLEAIVTSVSHLVNAEDIESIKNNKNIDAANRLRQKLTEIRNQLPISNLFIVAIEPVKKGEPVFLDRPIDEYNPIYTGENPLYAYRQVYLVDTSNKPNSPFDFSESNEIAVYNSKKTLITPIYEGLSTAENFMSGYAPVLNANDEVIALVGADINLKLYERNLHRALSLIALSGLATILMVTLASIFVATKITKPVQKLKDAALVLASGEYNDKIDVHGPKEIVELANTINTLRECLVDNMSRLTHYTTSQSKLYGEYECGELLQEHMLQKPAQDFQSSLYKIKALELDSNDPIGINLNVTENSGLEIVMKEAMTPGFEGLFKLLNNNEGRNLNLKISNEGAISYETNDLPVPLLWSTRINKFIPLTEGMHEGDFLVIYNSGLQKQIPHLNALKDWFQKVFKHFAKEGPDLAKAMVESELNFLGKKYLNHEDLKIILVYKTVNGITNPRVNSPRIG